MMPRVAGAEPPIPPLSLFLDAQEDMALDLADRLGELPQIAEGFHTLGTTAGALSDDVSLPAAMRPSAEMRPVSLAHSRAAFMAAHSALSRMVVDALLGCLLADHRPGAHAGEIAETSRLSVDAIAPCLTLVAVLEDGFTDLAHHEHGGVWPFNLRLAVGGVAMASARLRKALAVLDPRYSQVPDRATSIGLGIAELAAAFHHLGTEFADELDEQRHTVSVLVKL